MRSLVFLSAAAAPAALALNLAKSKKSSASLLQRTERSQIQRLEAAASRSSMGSSNSGPFFEVMTRALGADDIYLVDGKLGATTNTGPMGYIVVKDTKTGTMGTVCAMMADKQKACQKNADGESWGTQCTERYPKETKENMLNFVADICRIKGYVTGIPMPNTENDNLQKDVLWAENIDADMKAPVMAFPCWGAGFAECAAPTAAAGCAYPKALKVSCSAHVNCDPNLPGAECWKDATNTQAGVSSGDLILNAGLLTKQVKAFDVSFDTETRAFQAQASLDAESLQKQIDANKQKIQANQEAIAKNREDLLGHNTTMDTLTENVAVNEKTAEDEAGLLNNTAKVIADKLEKEAADAKEKRAKIKQEIVANDASLKTDIANQEAAADKAREELEGNLTAIVKESDEQRKALQEANTEKINADVATQLAKVADLQTTWNDTLKSMAGTSQEDREKIQANVNETKKVLAELSAANKQAAEKNTEEIATNNNAIATNAENIQKNDEKIEELTAALDTFEENMDKRKKELEAETLENQNAIAANEATIEKETADREEAVTDVTTKRDEADTQLTTERSANQKALDDAKKNIASAIEHAQKQRKSLSERIVLLKDRVQALEDWSGVDSCGPLE